MAVESAADRATFLSAADFGATATYTPAAGGGATTVKGIFDLAFQEIDVEAGVPVATRRPRFICSTADLSGGGAFGDTLVIDGTTYKVRVVEPDGTGMTELALEKQ